MGWFSRWGQRRHDKALVDLAAPLLEDPYREWPAVALLEASSVSRSRFYYAVWWMIRNEWLMLVGEDRWNQRVRLTFQGRCELLERQVRS